MRLWTGRAAGAWLSLVVSFMAVSSAIASQQTDGAVTARSGKLPTGDAVTAEVKSLSSPQYASDLAEELLKSGAFEDAERAVRAGLEIDLAAYLKRPNGPAAGLKEPLPELVVEREKARFRSELASCALTLGLIMIKGGRVEEGSRLLRQVEESGGVRTAAQFSTLADSAEARGDQAAALEYLMRAALTGRQNAEGRRRLEQSYEKTRGRASGLDEELDALYRKVYASPVDIGPDRGERPKAQKPVLSEFFTGAGCPPCVGEDLAIEAAMRKYTEQEYLVLMYHVHIPRPDPLTNPWTVERQRYYGVRTAPFDILDGVVGLDGGGPRSASQALFNRREAAFAKLLGKPALARLSVSARLSGGTIAIKAHVDRLERKPKSVRLHIALVEEEVRYAGENGIRLHPMVVRSLAGQKGEGLALTDSKADIEYVFDLDRITEQTKAYLDDYEEHGKFGKMKFREKKHELDREKLRVVAFLQDEKDKAVLQATAVSIQR